MKRLALALFAATALAGPVFAGQVQNPINAPSSVGSGDLFAASGSNAQQATDTGISSTTAPQNCVVSGPSGGGAGSLSCRAIASADLPSSGRGSGTVTSVALTLPAMFTVAGSPVTTSGALSATLATQSANLVLAGPTSGAAAAPTFRALVAADLPGGLGSGTVTSVGLTLPAIFTVSGSPITTSGSLSATLATQNANLIWGGPSSGGAAAPTFRSLVAADIPSLSYLASTGGTVTGTVTINKSTGSILQAGALTLQSADGVNNGFALDASGSSNILYVERVDGTYASPSALGSGEIIALEEFGGWDGSALESNQAGITATTTAAWVHGTTYEMKLILSATASGSTTRETEMTLQGGVGLGSLSGQAVGTMNAVGYYTSGTIGLTCSGTPTSSFASTKGIVTHC